MQYTTPRMVAAFRPSSIRRIFRAPMFCPAKVAMVVASASNTQQKKLFSRPAAETAATAMVPKPFTATCTTTEPMAVMEY